MNRTDRRRQQKEDVRALAQGLDVAARDARQVASLMRLLHEEVQEAVSSGSLQPLFSFFWSNMEKTRRQAPFDMIACKNGCAHCCHMWVSATAPEVLFVAATIKKRGMDVAAILRAAERTADMDFDARGKTLSPCPLLSEDGSCTVYDARPLACRTAASVDAEVCRRAYRELSGEEIQTPVFFVLQRTGYAVPLRGAFRQAGLPLVSYEYNQALSVALTTPDAEKRWLGGEDIFAGVRTDPTSDPLERAENRQIYEFAFRE